jgi:heat shock protein HtpX
MVMSGSHQINNVSQGFNQQKGLVIIVTLFIGVASLWILPLTWRLLLQSVGIEISESLLMTMCVIMSVLAVIGAFISWLWSWPIARYMLAIDALIAWPDRDLKRALAQTVQECAQHFTIAQPYLAFFNHPSPNAFAVRDVRKHTYIVISSGALQQFSHAQLRSMIAHECSHLDRFDQIVLSLLQGMVNLLTEWPTDFAVFMVGKLSPSIQMPVFYVLRIVTMSVMTAPLVLLIRYYSRIREFTADQAAARLVGYQDLSDLLRALHHSPEPTALPIRTLASFAVSGSVHDGFLKFFNTHPPLEYRLAALERVYYR